mgnify:CR=1 FL=1
MNSKIILLFLLSLFSLHIHAQSAIGFQSPEINLKSPDGTEISLLSLKGKVVIIDFWASWCMPCRTANKTLTKLHEKYKSKGLEIYSISLDKNKNAWNRAIKNDKMVWLNVLDEGMITATNWRIGYIPFTFILNQRGKIVAADVAATDIEKVIQQLL